MDIKISDHFSYKRLLKFVLPSIGMMVFTSIYGVVDGFFVSNYAGKTAFAGLNLIMPFIMLLGTFAFMVGTGGNALVSKKLGEGDEKKANEIFSMLVYTVIILGIVFTVISQIFLSDICVLLGADEEMLPYSIIYGRITLCSVTFFMLMNVFQSFLVTAGKPKIGLIVTLAAGIMNMILDYLFCGVLGWGLVGAASATVTSETIGGVVPLIYFFGKNSSTLRLCKTHFMPNALMKTCTNGASEFMTNISMSLVNMLYNLQLIKYYGQNGVAAYGTIMYVNFIFVAVYIGYSMGFAPIVGYNYGAKNHPELKNMRKKSLVIISFLAVILTSSAMLLAKPLGNIFAGYDEGYLELTVFAFRLFAFVYLINGFNIFASAFFTALNNGLISAVISFSRTLLFQVICIFLLPALFGRDTIWLSLSVAELLTLAVSVSFLAAFRKKYDY